MTPRKMRVSEDSPLSSNPSSFAVASADISKGRLIRNSRLREIASRLKSAPPEIGERELRAFLSNYPNEADALQLLAKLVAGCGRRTEAISILERCLDVAPDFTLARFNCARLLWEQHKYAQALEQLEVLLAEDAGNPLFRQLKSNILEATGYTEQSLAIFRDLAAENPGRAESWISYGHAARAAGIREESVNAYRMAIECRPSYGSAYWSLANMKTVRFDGADISAMLAQLSRPDIPQDDRILLQFALGKAYEDLREYERSWEQYSKANAAVRLRSNYDPDVLTASVAASKVLFTPELFTARKGMGCDARDPIFILGRPRSGSTLIEQILSSHSAVEGTAELPYITALAGRLSGRDSPVPHGKDYLNVLADFDAVALAGLGEEYLRDAQIHRKLNRPFFIDKKPANFAHIGLILLMLPNAKIIDARRNPAASCFSTFKTYRSKSLLRLSELGRFYRDYVEYMAHFDRVLPGRIHRVIYEELVADPETQTRNLLDYLGLPFEESCLRFYETERTVLTPSSEQVRKPISSDAVDHWRNYEPWLGQLTASLGSVLVHYPVVPEELR